MNIVELKAAMMKLPEEIRAEPAKARVECLEISKDEPIQLGWVDEAVRRRDQVGSGEVETVPCDQVFAEVRERLAR